MANNREIRELLDATAYDADGDKLGGVKEVYINDSSGQPDFIEVNHGLFGMSSSLVPLRGHSLDGDNLRLAFQKERIKDAPNVDANAHLSNEDQDALYRHYGLESTDNVTTYNDDVNTGGRADTNTANTGRNAAAGAGVAGAGVAGAGVAGATTGRHHTDDATVDGDVNRTAAAADRDATVGDRDAAVAGQNTAGTAGAANVDQGDGLIRSEERLNVDKDRVNTGEVRLRKYVKHDTETVEVPVEREEVTIERTPIDPDTAAAKGAGAGKIGEEEASVTLHEDRVNVTKETVPVEEVHLNKQTVRDTETVSEDVAKEQIETEGTDGTTPRQ